MTGAGDHRGPESQDFWLWAIWCR